LILLFWASALFVAYTFIGYPAAMWLLARLRPMPVKKLLIQPTVSVVMAVHNGGSLLKAKLENLAELAYPKELLEVIVASDGSTDGTAALLNSAPGVKSVVCPRVGKAEALNRALAVTRNEIVVFTDIRQGIRPNAITALVSNFADESVGCVSGELMFASPNSNLSGISSYWRLEKMIRKSESASGSVMGVTGALYALRRSLFTPIPAGTLVDDLYVPLQVIRQGKRVVFESNAEVWDAITQSARSEFLRKVRTLAGNLQIVELMPSVLIDSRISFRLVSHKLSRLVAAWLLLMLFAGSWMLSGSPFYRTIAILQSAFYSLALTTALVPHLLNEFTGAIKAFCVMNAAALAAPFSYLRYRNDPMKIWANLRVPVEKPELVPTIPDKAANSGR
jgi:poly-beta-1,6-N-acetyl-D-glucosamine synthase